MKKLIAAAAFIAAQWQPAYAQTILGSIPEEFRAEGGGLGGGREGGWGGLGGGEGGGGFGPGGRGSGRWRLGGQGGRVLRG